MFSLLDYFWRKCEISIVIEASLNRFGKLLMQQLKKKRNHWAMRVKYDWIEINSMIQQKKNEYNALKIIKKFRYELYKVRFIFKIEVNVLNMYKNY